MKRRIFLGFKVSLSGLSRNYRRALTARSTSAVPIGWLLFGLIVVSGPQAFAQLAPTGEHYAGRPSDTGYGGSRVDATGVFATAIPLELPPARGELPIPLQITYGARGVGAAGLGWDVPLSYIQHDSTLAHRRPASSAGALPQLRERTYLSLLGQSAELMLDGDVWVARSGTLELAARENGSAWLVYDGQGRTYTFTRPAALGDTGLWLLKSVSAEGGASIELTYRISAMVLDGGFGTSIDLVSIAYNTELPTIRPLPGCAKNVITLTYGPGSATPLSMSILDDRVLVRNETLKLLDVNSRATCHTPLQRLRRYEFQYVPDTDTQLPRLHTVRVFGRQGTPEENTALPIATYSYGSATEKTEKNETILHYEHTQTLDWPIDAEPGEISTTVADSSVNAPVQGHPYAMWRSLTDLTGDGRPDLIFKHNDKLFVAYNLPAPDGSTTLGVGPQAIAQLPDAMFAKRAFSMHTTTEQRFQYGAHVHRNTTNVWRRAIDVNGDGRIDIIDAAEEPDRWVIYLNTPGPAGDIKWERRSFSVAHLRAELTSFGHVIDGQYLPLSRRATGTNVKGSECWRWDGTNWQWYLLGFATHKCQGFIDDDTPDGPELTFVEWDLLDLNGDGYPDFVFNSSPVDFQMRAPPKCPDPFIPNCQPGRTYPSPQLDPPVNPVLKNFGPGLNEPGGSFNEIRASFNVVGVRFDTDRDVFSQSVSLFAKSPAGGVSEWVCSSPTVKGACDEKTQWQVAGFADVNGDGLVDRVVDNKAYLGAYYGTALFFSPVYITLPGPLATVVNTHKEQCESPRGNQKPESKQKQGLRDLTGDGIPDYYYFDANVGLGDNPYRVWVGTGTGFLEPIKINSSVNFVFSHQTELCDGSISNTDGGLFDIDGDGKPDIVTVGHRKVTVNGIEQEVPAIFVSQLVGGQGAGRPEAGRLTEIDNGYGAHTSINYVSAKRFTDNPVPFPEIVVSSVATTGTQNLGGTLAGTRYAYGHAELVFDSALDRFSFPGYRRFIELRLFGPQEVPPDGRAPPVGDATITDAWPLTQFSTGLTKQERWQRMVRVGRVRDVLALRALVNPDPWALLNVIANQPQVIGVTHYEWNAKLYEVPRDPSENVLDCFDMVHPLDYALSFADNGGVNGIDACRAHGFAFAISRDSWFGDASPPSDNNVQTRTQTFAVDDFGHSLITEYDNDVFRGDDDICSENTFAKPNGAFPRILHAQASRRFYACGKDITFASESWAYDGLPPGVVSDGRVTSHDLDRRNTGNGGLLNTVHEFDATYDAAGNLITVRTQRGGAIRTVTLGYDSFGLVPIDTRVDATGIPSNNLVTRFDPVSLQTISSTDANQVTRGIDFDGFGRPVRATLTPPGGTLGVVSAASYLGFSETDPDGRRVTVTQFSDPVPPANVSTTSGRTRTIFLDELGRERRTEFALGSDYANQILVAGSRAYDGAGRVVFQADPYPNSQDPATAYGTSYYFTDTDDLNCIVRGRGRQVLSMVTDPATERFPTCFQRSFAGHVDTLDVRDGASLEAGSPQAGVVQRVVATAIGRVIERSTLLPGLLQLEDATFAYDRLGKLTSMTRFLDPASATFGVQWSWQLDSLGETLQLLEPDTATRSYSYSDWGELIETQWSDSGIDRRLVRTYDALGRLTATEERSDGVTDPETLMTYTYDIGVNVSPLVVPTFVLGQVARATSSVGQTTFSYDALGRVNGLVFTDNQGGLYIEKAEHHADSRLTSLEFNLPDQNYTKELVNYAYDSAGSVRAIDYADASGAFQLYRADDVDVLGRVRKALYAGNTRFHATYSNQGRRLIQEKELESPLGSRRIMFGQFDPLGRELSRREITDAAASGRRTTISYDRLGRMQTAMQTDGATTLFDWNFDYDALGNIRRLGNIHHGADNATISYQANDRDRICRIDYGLATGVPCNVTHDVLGNVVTEPARTGSRNLTYFLSGAIRTITEQGTQASFAYDPFGQVQALDIQGTPAQERHDRRYGGLIEKRTLSGSPTTSLITRRIPGPDGILASRHGPGNEWVFEFGELRGNRFFTNRDGVFIQEVDYQPFGEANSTGISPGTPSYTSYQWNDGDALAPFGLSHLGARIYDPVIGRFLSRDPLMVPQTATTSNPYAFAANDPFNAADPTGLDCSGGIGQECQFLAPLLSPLGVLATGLLTTLGSFGHAYTAAQKHPAVVQFMYDEARFEADQARYCADPNSHLCFTRAPEGSQVLGAIASGLVGVPSYYFKTEVSRAAMQSARNGVEYFKARDMYNAEHANRTFTRINEETARFFGAAMALSGGLMGLGANGAGVGRLGRTSVSDLALPRTGSGIRVLSDAELAQCQGGSCGFREIRVALTESTLSVRTESALGSLSPELESQFQGDMARLARLPTVGVYRGWSKPWGQWQWIRPWGRITYDVEPDAVVIRSLFLDSRFLE
jgi:RHS repeat-associated protein